MSTYFSADGNAAYVTCRVCDTDCDAMLFYFDDEDGELTGWPQPRQKSLWGRIKHAIRFVRYGHNWVPGISVGWHELTDRDDVKALGEWLVEKSGRIGMLETEETTEVNDIADSSV